MLFLWEDMDEGSGLVFQIFVGTPQEGSVGRLLIASMERGVDRKSQFWRFAFKGSKLLHVKII